MLNQSKTLWKNQECSLNNQDLQRLSYFWSCYLLFVLKHTFWIYKSLTCSNKISEEKETTINFYVISFETYFNIYFLPLSLILENKQHFHLPVFQLYQSYSLSNHCLYIKNDWFFIYKTKVPRSRPLKWNIIWACITNFQ